MKITTVTAAEEKRSTTLPAMHPEDSQTPSFAESLGESLAAGSDPRNSPAGGADPASGRWNGLSMRLKDDNSVEIARSVSSEKVQDAVADVAKEKSVDLLMKPMKQSSPKVATDTKVIPKVGAPEGQKEAGAHISFKEGLSQKGIDLLRSEGEENGSPESLAKMATKGGNASMQPGQLIPQGQVESPVAGGASQEEAQGAAEEIGAFRVRLVMRSSEEILQGDSGSLGVEAKKGLATGVKSEGDKREEHSKVAKQGVAVEGQAVAPAVDGQQTAAAFAPSLVMAPAVPLARPLTSVSGEEKVPALTGSKGVQGSDRLRVRAEKTADTDDSSPSTGDDLSSTTKKVADPDSRHTASMVMTQGIDADSLSSRGAEKAHVQVETLHGAMFPASQEGTNAVTNSALEKTSSFGSHMTKPQEDLPPGASSLYVSEERRTLAATPTSLEVGISGGTHGWLKVRAEMAGDGAVHASVSASSSAGTEMLRRELPSITSYLHQEQVAVSSVVIHAPSSATSMSDPSSGGQGAHREAGQGAADAGGGRQDATAMAGGKDVSRQGAAEEDGGEDYPSVGYGGAGGWLSIRA